MESDRSKGPEFLVPVGLLTPGLGPQRPDEDRAVSPKAAKCRESARPVWEAAFQALSPPPHPFSQEPVQSTLWWGWGGGVDLNDPGYSTKGQVRTGACQTRLKVRSVLDHPLPQAGSRRLQSASESTCLVPLNAW